MSENIYKVNILEDWHKRWVRLCELRTDFSVKFSNEQKEHFEKLLDRIKFKDTFVKYSSVHKYIFEIYESQKERLPEQFFKGYLDTLKWHELHLIFFHYYYNIFLDEESKKVVEPFLNPKEYNHRYELKFTSNFLGGFHNITKKPTINIYGIDKEIIKQMDTYQGGEKIAFLDYQIEKFEYIVPRLRSWKAYLQDFKGEFHKPSTYELGINFIEEKLTNSDLIKIYPPVKTNLSVPQLALFYRLLHEVEFYDSNQTLTSIFTLLNKGYATKQKDYPAITSLSRSTDKLKKRDAQIIIDYVEKLSKKATANLNALAE